MSIKKSVQSKSASSTPRTSTVATTTAATKATSSAVVNAGLNSRTITAEFPKTQLMTWLKNRQSWNHQDWLDLLSSLEKAGFSALTSSQSGRETIGAFIEANRQLRQ
ncbi:MAG: hypothetical protein HQK53_13220 [Oligoflexia bacterium]|nr:hypothetical protein [Oligoflexia bacterium]